MGFSSHIFRSNHPLTFIVYLELLRWWVNLFLPTQNVLNHHLLFMIRGVLLAVYLPLVRHLLLTHKKTYDPTIEDAYRKQLVVDNRMCFVEVSILLGRVSNSLPFLSFSGWDRHRGVCDIARSMGSVSWLVFLVLPWFLFSKLNNKWGPRFHSRLLNRLPVNFWEAWNISPVYAKGQARQPHIHVGW